MKKAEIKQLIKNASLKTDPKVNKAVLNSLLEEFEESKKTQPAIYQPSIWRIIMKTKITKFAAAAVIIAAVIEGINHFGGSVDMASVTWGNVLEYVEHVSTVAFRVTVVSTVTGKDKPVEAQKTIYFSSEYGTRADMYVNDEIVSTEYMPAGDNTIIIVIPEEKKYLQIVLPHDKAKQRHEMNDPRQMVMRLMSAEYKELEPTQIDGVNVEGIESHSPRIAGGMFENATARLWVDVQTDLPVLMEIEGVAGDGSMQMKMVIDDFQWDVEFEPSMFEPNIPSDYTKKEMGLPEVTAETAIHGLEVFAELTDGRYPSSLALLTIMKEIGEAFKAKHGDDAKQKMGEGQFANIMQSILPAGAFYTQLQNKDVAYYGDTVTTEDIDAVLMRWKISGDEYRVIFGDLTAENVAAERLAELEEQYSQ